MFELLAFKNELELSAFADKSVEKRSTLFDKAFFLVAQDLLLRNAGNEAAGPSLCELLVQNVEFVITTDHLELAL